MLGLARDVNALRAPARARARHDEHCEREARTEHNADADKNSRRGFLLVPRYLELWQRLLSERRRRENREVRGETASDSPHQNKGGVGPGQGGMPVGAFDFPGLPGLKTPEELLRSPSAGTNLQGKFWPNRYELTPGAVRGLQRFFDPFGFDVRDITLKFGNTFGARAYTFGNTVTLDEQTWQSLSPKGQRELLAHEITHSVQYRDLGMFDFLTRYQAEFPLYGVPSNLRQIPLNGLNVTDPRFSLDQLADRVQLEYFLKGP